jgi:hypothetical protein
MSFNLFDTFIIEFSALDILEIIGIIAIGFYSYIIGFSKGFEQGMISKDELINEYKKKD